MKEDAFLGIGPKMRAAGENIERDCARADKCQHTSSTESKISDIEILEKMEFEKLKMELNKWISGFSFDFENGQMDCNDTSQQRPVRASFTENGVTDCADGFEQTPQNSPEESSMEEPKPKKRKVEESCIQEAKPRKEKVVAKKVGAKKVGAKKVGAEKTAQKKVGAKTDRRIPSYPVAIATAMIYSKRNWFLVNELHSEVTKLFPKLGARDHFMNCVRHSLDNCKFFVKRPYIENKWKTERYQYGINSSQRSTANRKILKFINENAENVDERVLQVRSQLL